MSTFPNLSNINAVIADKIKSRANNINASNLMPWIRLSTASGWSADGGGGLVLESLPFKSETQEDGSVTTYSTDTLQSRYGGGTSKSGRIGTDFKGDSVYAPAETEDRINKPSPIIEALTVSNGQEGLSKHCEFVIKCHTLSQADIISSKFLEPGYMVLVEFGWNTSLAIQQKIDLTKSPICAMAKYNSYDYVQSKKQKSEGTYDAFLGYITGGDIKSADSDNYNVSVKLTTIGELPSYYQRHTATSSPNDSQTKTNAFAESSNVESNLNEGKDIGKSLFKLMYNELPKAKQSEQFAKTLLGGKDVLGTPWTSSHNFLNFDKVITKKFSELYSDEATVLNASGSLSTLPEGAKLVDDERFIRLELAFAILNTTNKVLKQADVVGCKGVKTYNFEINTNDCICRAFPNIFSIDKNILYIPNTKLPRFNLTDVLTNETPKTNLVSLVSGSVTETFNGNLADKPLLNTEINKGLVNPYLYSFPLQFELSSAYIIQMSGYKTTTVNSDVLPTKSKSGTAGWLRNLYINFDFFLDVIGRDSMTTIDVYYELLNGISSAVNNQWVFEIVEQDSATDSYKELAVKELTFSGIVENPLNDSNNKDENGNLKTPIFYTRGKNTPFIESSLEINIPAAMKNSIIGSRLAKALGEENDELTHEGPMIQTGDGLFTNVSDPLLSKLASFNISDKDSSINNTSDAYEPTDEEIYNFQKENRNPHGGGSVYDDRAVAIRVLKKRNADKKKEEIKNKNFDIFSSSAGIYPYVNNRKLVGAALGGLIKQWFTNPASRLNIDDYLLIGTYDDVSTFRMIYAASAENSIGILMPINFTFSLHGISGLRVGDIFSLADLPPRFTQSVFQVLEVSHTISDGKWLTNVRAGYRQI